MYYYDKKLRYHSSDQAGGPSCDPVKRLNLTKDILDYQTTKQLSKEYAEDSNPTEEHFIRNYTTITVHKNLLVVTIQELTNNTKVDSKSIVLSELDDSGCYTLSYLNSLY